MDFGDKWETMITETCGEGEFCSQANETCIKVQIEKFLLNFYYKIFVRKHNYPISVCFCFPRLYFDKMFTEEN